LGKNFQKTAGGIFWTHTRCLKDLSDNSTSYKYLDETVLMKLSSLIILCDCLLLISECKGTCDVTTLEYFEISKFY